MRLRFVILITILSGKLCLSLRGEERATVSLLTARAGEEIYQLEGHTALRINDPLRGDYVVNWGLFDFAAPNFVYRFVKGETEYMAGAAPTEYFLEMYRREGRTVVEQVLDLTPEEVSKVIEITDRNLQPENRSYLYDYVKDNCATRPLAVIEQAIADTLTLGPSGLPEEAGRSFRRAMKHYHANYPWYQFGIDLALGSDIDRDIEHRELSFSPEALEKMMADAQRSSGRSIVSTTRVLVEGKTPSAVLPPTPWFLTPMFWSIILLAIAICVSIKQFAAKKLTLSVKIFDTIFFGVIFVAGMILTFLIFVSIHQAASPNWLYLWLNPAALAGAVPVWSKRGEKLLKSYQFINFALLVVLGIALLFGAQSANPAFIPLIIADGVRALTCVVTLPPRRKA